ncbi:ribulose-phosphate 3-epimerase [Candidatus Micrarchaeota archaeon]|nr:ribulose-phosphate 3-epimerase [Candidatus Micrarchaeota archaeon]
MNVLVYPSMLSADVTNFKNELKRVEAAEADGVHWDVMDLHFVPNLTFGFSLIRDLRKHTALYFDVHLMIEHPGKWIDAFADAGADHITFHIEACETFDEAMQIIQKIKKKKKQVGIALKPATDWRAIQSALPLLDAVLVMTVEPGFGGQALMPDMLEKIKSLRQHVDENQLKTRIQVDGGITIKNVQTVKAAGADCLVSGSGIFQFKTQTEMANVIQEMRRGP